MTEINDRNDIDIVDRLDQMADEFMADGMAINASLIWEAIGAIKAGRNEA